MFHGVRHFIVNRASWSCALTFVRSALTCALICSVAKSFFRSCTSRSWSFFRSCNLNSSCCNSTSFFRSWSSSFESSKSENSFNMVSFASCGIPFKPKISYDRVSNKKEQWVEKNDDQRGKHKIFNTPWSSVESQPGPPVTPLYSYTICYWTVDISFGYLCSTKASVMVENNWHSSRKRQRSKRQQSFQMKNWHTLISYIMVSKTTNRSTEQNSYLNY